MLMSTLNVVMRFVNVRHKTPIYKNDLLQDGNEKCRCLPTGQTKHGNLIKFKDNWYVICHSKLGLFISCLSHATDMKSAAKV